MSSFDGWSWAGAVLAGLRRGALVCVVGGMCVLAGGCPPKPPAAYFGPTEDLATIAQKINANNSRVSSLYARHDFEANVADESGKLHFVNGGGVLQYRSTGDFRLIGEGAITDLFDLGIDGRSGEFWLVAERPERTMWTGNRSALGREGGPKLPIRPDLVLEVLGVSALGTNLLAAPAPTLRFNNDADAYMVVWVAPRPDRLVAVKEVWYDRKTLLPKIVLLFDENGRVLVRAYLDKHAGVEGTGKGAERAQVATVYRLFFPENRSRIDIVLQSPALKSEKGFPKDVTFRPPNPEGVEPSRRIDLR